MDMKRRLLIASAILALIISGCSNKTQEVTPQKQQSKQAKSKKPQKPKSEAADEKVNTISGNVNEEEQDTSVASSSTSNETEDMQEVGDLSQIKIYFDFDKFNIRDDMKEEVLKAAQRAQALPDGTIIRIEGNCDEWGTDEYNYALGLKRAKSVKDSLTAEGISDKKLKLISYGESNPVCTEHNRACWQKNRRVEFKVLQ